MGERLPFLETVARGEAGRPALYLEDEGRWWDYATLSAKVASGVGALGGPGHKLAFLFFANKPGHIAAYLSLLAAGHVPALFDPGLAPDLVARLIETYSPALVVGQSRLAPLPCWRALDGLGAPCWRTGAEGPALHPDLCLLLSTSGSTGSPKLVRLGRKAVAANTDAIVGALAIGATERALAHLALHYSFGLSVLQTHLAAGASLVPTGRTMMEMEFWDLARGQGVTSLSGTPFHIAMLKRLDIERLDVPALSVIAQAGGRLAPELALAMARTMAARGGRFHVMYGQTEAAPRLSVMPALQVAGRPASVGLPLEGGAFEIEGANGVADTPGPVLYRGPNVMMGYALSAGDLAHGDEMGGRLATGDLGYLDAEGYLFLTGRAARFAKAGGVRVSLDELEAMAGPLRRVAAIEAGGAIRLFAEGATAGEISTLRRDLQGRLRLGSGFLKVEALAQLPLTSQGKVDYQALRMLP